MEKSKFWGDFRKNIKKKIFSLENVRNLLELVYIMQSLSKVFLRNFMESFLDSRKTCEEILNQPFLGIPMKTNTLGTTLLVIGVILGMSAWMLHDRGETTPPESSPKNQNTITQTGISSGTIQVIHSGVADFHMPNLEWKSRDVTLADGRTLHYVFGEGNPKGVALDQEGLEKLAVQCDNDHSGTLAIAGICDAESGRPLYVSAEVEYLLASSLASEDWKNLFKFCKDAIRFGDGLFPLESTERLRFDEVFSTNFLDIDNFLLVDKDTGFKKIDRQKLWQITSFLEWSRGENGRGEPIINPYGNCVDQYGQGIIDNLYKTFDRYMLPS